MFASAFEYNPKDYLGCVFGIGLKEKDRFLFSFEETGRVGLMVISRVLRADWHVSAVVRES